MSLKQLDPAYLTCEDISQFDYTFAARLIKRGANPDAIDTRSGNSLLHNAAFESNEAAAVFLVHHGAVPNLKNVLGEAPIHIAAKHGLHRLVEVLLQYGADPNLQTALKPKPPTPAPMTSPVPHSMAASMRAEDITPDVMSPTTLGALSALSATSQLTSVYSFDGNLPTSSSARTSSGYSSQIPPPGGETQFRQSPMYQRSSSPVRRRTGGNLAFQRPDSPLTRQGGESPMSSRGEPHTVHAQCTHTYLDKAPHNAIRSVFLAFIF